MVVMIAMISQMKMDVQRRPLWFVQKECFAVMETAYKVICSVMEKTIVVMDSMREDVVSIEIVHSWMRRCERCLC